MGIFEKIFIKSGPETVSELMSAEEFWDLIGHSYSAASGNYSLQQDELRTLLRRLTPINLLRFDNTFRHFHGEAYHWNLWGAVYTIHGGCFEDSFADFRSWLVAQGKEFYFSTLENPESLVLQEPEVIDIDWSGLSDIAKQVYHEKTGKKMQSTFQENKELKGEEWEEFSNDLRDRFPKLWVKYNRK